VICYAAHRKNYYTSAEAVQLIEQVLPGEDAEQNLKDALKAGHVEAAIFDDETSELVPIPTEQWDQRTDTFESSLICNLRDSTGYLFAQDVRHGGQMRIDKHTMDNVLSNAKPLSHEKPALKSSRKNAQRRKDTKFRNSKIQDAAEKIWLAEEKDTGKVLSKMAVVKILRGRKDIAELLFDRRGVEEIPITDETILKLIRVPDALKGRRKVKGETFPKHRS
jgi:hypothetical protein